MQRKRKQLCVGRVVQAAVLSVLPAIGLMSSQPAVAESTMPLAIAMNASTAVGADPVRIPSGRAELFADDYLIEKHENLVRTLRRPRKEFAGREPIITSKPGTTLLAMGSIVFDPRLNQYVGFVREHSPGDTFRITSKDGLTWDQTHHEDLTRVSFPRDVEPQPGTRGKPNLDLFSCYYNLKDRDFPYQGWLYYSNVGPDREGIYFVRSADGLTWERGPLVVNAYAGPDDASSQTIHQDGKTVYGPGDVTVFTYDPVEDRFLGLFKFFTTQNVGEGNNLRSRAYLFLDAIDKPVDTSRIKRIALLPPAADRDGDTKYDEFYASTAWRYGSLWLGGLKVYHLRGDYPYSASGCAFLKLAVSRNGLNWDKVPFCNDEGVPEVFIANGPEGGSDDHKDGRNDGGYMTEFSGGPLQIGDELIYYYGSSSYGKNHPVGTRMTGGGIFRARLRLDGFVSIDGGTLTTRPLTFDGSELYVNGVGPVTVSVLDDEGKTLGSAGIEGDSVRHAVRFDGKTLSEIAPARRVRLRFEVQPPCRHLPAGAPGGRLYSFQIR